MAWLGRDIDASFNKYVGWANILALSVGAVGVLIVIGDRIDVMRRRMSSADLNKSALSVAREAQRQYQDLLSSLLRTDLVESRSAEGRFVSQQGSKARNRQRGENRGTLATVKFSEVGTYFLDKTTKRLLITGEPGSGKTVLCLKLAIELLEFYRRGWEQDREAGAAVPVFVSAATWDPGSQGLEEWFTEEAARRFRISQSISEQLVAAGRIFPVVDGLDEMDGESSELSRGRAAALAINRYIATTPNCNIVITCRADERRYESLVREVRNVHAIKVASFTPASIANYLEEHCVDASSLESWKPVLDVIKKPNGRHVAAALSTPWRLGAAIAFSSSGGDPRALLPTAQEKNNQPAYRLRIRNILLDSFLASRLAASSYLCPAAAQTVHQLKTLARLSKDDHREAGPCGPIKIDQWWRVFGERRALIGQIIVAYFLMHLPFAVLGELPIADDIEPGTTPFTVLAIMTNYGTIMLFCYMYVVRRKRAYRFQFSVFRNPTMLVIVIGLCVFGIVGIGVPFWYLRGPLYAAAFAAAAVVYTVFRFAATRAEMAAPLGPTTYVRGDAQVSLVLAPICGACAWLYYYWIYGMYPALVLSTMIALALVATSIYMRFLVSCFLGWKRERLPFRLVAFLDECVTVGIMRVNGGAFEFRHRELAEYLTATGA